MSTQRWLSAGAASALVLLAVAQGAEPAGEEAGGLPQLNSETYASQVFWLVLTFGALYLLMARVFLPRLGGMIEERRQRIADDFDQAAEFTRQAEKAEDAYKQALADAKARASRIAQETRDQIDAEIKEMQAATDEKLEAEIEAAETRIGETAEAAAATVREAARETTRAVVMALIDEQPSDEAVEAALASVAGGQH